MSVSDGRRTGSLRPTSGPPYMGKRSRNGSGGGGSSEKHKRKPPRGMYINHDDIVTLASNPNANSDDLLSSMDREVVALMSQVSTDRLVIVISGLSEREDQEGWERIRMSWTRTDSARKEFLGAGVVEYSFLLSVLEWKNG